MNQAKTPKYYEYQDGIDGVLVITADYPSYKEIKQVIDYQHHTYRPEEEKKNHWERLKQWLWNKLVKTL